MKLFIVEEGIVHNCEMSVLQDNPIIIMQTEKQYHKRISQSTSKQYCHHNSQHNVATSLHSLSHHCINTVQYYIQHTCDKHNGIITMELKSSTAIKSLKNLLHCHHCFDILQHYHTSKATTTAVAVKVCYD